MHRRAFLAAGLSTAVAGCLSDSSDDGTTGSGDDGSTGDGTDGSSDGQFALGDVPDASASTRGLAPDEYAEDVAAPDVDVDALETYDSYEEPVPLLPVDAAYDWYRRRDARFVDARSQTAYERSHLPGAVHSPAPDARQGATDGPVGDWSKSERIVAYCGCPHHLSGQRAAELRGQGYEAVYAIDEGFYEWRDRGYPTTGSEAAAASHRTVSGILPARFGGSMVRVRDAATNQVEPGVVRQDGSFDVEFVFYDLAPEDHITVETPAGDVTGPVAELTAEPVRL